MRQNGLTLNYCYSGDYFLAPIRVGSQGSVPPVACFTAWQATAALVYSNRPTEPAASTYVSTIIFRQIAIGIQLFVRQRCWCSSRISAGAVSSAGTDVGRDTLETTSNYSVTHYVSHVGWLELPSAILLLWGLSDPRIAELLLNRKTQSLDVWACLGVNIYAQNPLLGEWRETMEQPTMPFHLTLTYHSSHHRTALFWSITISLKWPLVLKSDVKQQFITTTTHPSIAYLCLVLIAKHKSGRLGISEG